ncbi:MAG: hypothetical protein HZB62_15095 [Nitrospirae bacterium]|nr:hypothetical protein [Nitrospirota bacterium]
MTNKKIITIALSVSIIHFVLASVIGHYIAVQIGTEIGQVVVGGLSAASDKAKSEEEATRILQNMKSKSDEIKAKWQIPELIISLPAKPLINPLLKEIRQNQMNKVITKEISRDQFRTQGQFIDYIANFLNSLALGLLVYIALKIINQKITKGST